MQVINYDITKIKPYKGNTKIHTPEQRDIVRSLGSDKA